MSNQKYSEADQKLWDIYYGQVIQAFLTADYDCWKGSMHKVAFDMTDKMMIERSEHLSKQEPESAEPKSVLPEGWSIEESVHFKYLIRYKDRIKIEVRSPEFSTSIREEVFWRLLHDIHTQENQQ